MPSKNLGRVSIVPKGTWNANTVYNRLDAVVYDGSSWLAKKKNTGQLPAEGSDAWQLLAERGADGRQGIDGAPGKGLTIIGHFDTVESLEASVTMPEPGDAYSIGDAEPYDIYTYDGVSQSWFNNGPLQGLEGPQGPKGDKGDIGPQGPKGDNGADGSDANVTADNIKTALGYAPGKMVHNLLDNSDFRNPVNQRGNTSYSNATQYTIDRWMTSPGAVTVNDNSISITKGSSSNYALFIQYVPDCVIGKSYTFAAKKTTGEIAILNFVYSIDMVVLTKPFENTNHQVNVRYSSSKTCLAVGIDVHDQTSVDLEYAALYEGEYTEETLPEYQPNGYAAELLKCQRYYYKISGANSYLATGLFNNSTNLIVPFMLPMPMRITPTLSYSNVATYRSASTLTATALSILRMANPDRPILYVTVASGGTTNAAAMLYFDGTGYIDFSADL